MVKQTGKSPRRTSARVRRAEERRRAEQRRRWLYAAAATVAVAAVAVAWFATRPAPAPAVTSSTPAGPAPQITTYPDEGRDHIPLGSPHPSYNSNPPSSGWHTPQTVAWGAHSQVVPDEVVLHNLEHGGIWISYRNPKDAATVATLQEIVGRYRSKVVLTPRPQDPSPIAVVAWQHVMLLDKVDERAIVDFIDRFKNKGPERVPD